MTKVNGTISPKSGDLLADLPAPAGL